ncbi:MAG: phosphatase PAP2 family protein [Beijerinckiaceae bacterium]
MRPEFMGERWPTLGASPAPRKRLAPIPADDACGPGRRLIACALVFAPWKAAYALLSRMPEPPTPATLRFSWEAHLPRPGLAIWIYAAAVAFALCAPLALRTAADLRRFVIAGWLIAATGLSMFVLLPSKAHFLPIAEAGMAGAVHQAMRTFDAEWLAFPSFHAAWAMLAAQVYRRRWPGLAALWLICAAAIGASCVLTGSHAIVDVLAGFAIAWLIWRWAADN